MDRIPHIHMRAASLAIALVASAATFAADVSPPESTDVPQSALTDEDATAELPKIEPCYPTGSDTAEGVICDVTRAFIANDWKIFEEACIPPFGPERSKAEYEQFMQMMEAEFEAQRQSPTPSPIAPVRIAHLFEAQPFSRNGPASAAYAFYDLRDLRFVDMLAETHDGQTQPMRMLAVKTESRWYALPYPDAYHLISADLNTEPHVDEEVLPLLTFPDHRDLFVGREVRIRGTMSDTKQTQIIGVYVETPANADLRGQVAEAVGVLECWEDTEEQLEQAERQYGAIQSAGPGVHYRLFDRDRGSMSIAGPLPKKDRAEDAPEAGGGESRIEGEPQDDKRGD